MRKIERFDKYMKYKGLNDNKVTVQLGLSVGVLGKSRKDGRDLSDKVIEQILNFYTELNKVWLLTGEGDMLKSGATLIPQTYYGGGSDSPSSTTAPPSGLPLITVDAIAGFPSDNDKGVLVHDCDTYNIPEFAAKGAQYLIRVSGSSMYPKYSNGDILACRKVESVTFFQWGKVYVLDTCQGALVKRLFEDKTNADNVICHSDNSDNYPDFTLPKSEIRTLSIVVGVIRME